MQRPILQLNINVGNQVNYVAMNSSFPTDIDALTTITSSHPLKQRGRAQTTEGLRPVSGSNLFLHVRSKMSFSSSPKLKIITNTVDFNSTPEFDDKGQMSTRSRSRSIFSAKKKSAPLRSAVGLREVGPLDIDAILSSSVLYLDEENPKDYMMRSMSAAEYEIEREILMNTRSPLSAYITTAFDFTDIALIGDKLVTANVS